MTFRPALRPGAALLRRDATTLQVGTSPGVVVADRPGLLAVLRLVDGARDVHRLAQLVATTVPEFRDDLDEVLRELRSLGVVFDASRWSVPGRQGLATEARHLDVRGADTRTLVRRAGFRVALLGDPEAAPVVDVVRDVLHGAGVVECDATAPDLLVVVSCGEPGRTVFERARAQGLAHLPVVVDEDRVRLGPLVRPGRTPCLTCHDLHRADWDRAWVGLVPQLGRHTAVRTPPAVGAATAHAAGIEVAVEVLAVADGTTARTAGHCLAVGPRHDDRTTWPLPFHHACGCGLLGAA